VLNIILLLSLSKHHQHKPNRAAALSFKHKAGSCI
jgi:hypothetical protein